MSTTKNYEGRKFLYKELEPFLKNHRLLIKENRIEIFLKSPQKERNLKKNYGKKKIGMRIYGKITAKMKKKNP